MCVNPKIHEQIQEDTRNENPRGQEANGLGRTDVFHPEFIFVGIGKRNGRKVGMFVCGSHGILRSNSKNENNPLQDDIAGKDRSRQGACSEESGLFFRCQFINQLVISLRHAHFTHMLMALHTIKREIDVGKRGCVEVLVLGCLGQFLGRLLEFIGI